VAAATRSRALTARHVEDIHVTHHFQNDFSDAAPCKLGFALLDEVGIFGDQAAIQHKGNVEVGSQGVHLTQVLQ